MIQIKSEMATRGGAVLDAWRNFWFRPQLAYTLGIVRIAFGALLIVWTLWMFRSLETGFGSEGLLPKAPARPFTWGVFHLFPSDEALFIGWGVLLAASIALMVGWHSRLAAILVFILVMSLERRNPAIFNGGDALLRIETIFMALAPCGAALSFDQRRRTGSFFSAREVPPWALRLFQIQLSIVYLATVVEKLGGETWQNGTAVLFATRQHDLQSIPLPEAITHSLFVSNALTWGTLVIEVAIGILVWNRRWRPWVLAAGVTLHLSISLSIQVGFFTWVTFVLYLAFVPPERAEAIAKGAQSRLLAFAARLRRRGDDSDDDSDAFSFLTRHPGLSTADAGTAPAPRNGERHNAAQPVAVDPRPPAQRHPQGSALDAALDAVKRTGQPPTPPSVPRARRLAEAPPRDDIAPPARVPAAVPDFDDEPSGRHSRRARHALN